MNQQKRLAKNLCKIENAGEMENIVNSSLFNAEKYSDRSEFSENCEKHEIN